MEGLAWSNLNDLISCVEQSLSKKAIGIVEFASSWKRTLSTLDQSRQKRFSRSKVSKRNTIITLVFEKDDKTNSSTVSPC